MMPEAPSNPPNSDAAALSVQARTRRTRLLLSIAVLGGGLAAAMLLLPSGQERQLRVQQHFLTAHRPVLGDPKVGGEVILFLDYSCPACKIFDKQIPNIRTRLIDSGEMHLVVMHSPFINESSKRAANAAECIYRQSNDAFWNYTQALYDAQGSEDQDWATPALLFGLAAKQNINLPRWSSCVASGEGAQAIENDLQQHRQAGMIGTPAVFVNGFRTPPGGQEILSALRDHPASPTQP